MKYELLIKLPTHDAGIIQDEKDWNDLYDFKISAYPKWFKPVEEFEKKLEFDAIGYDTNKNPVLFEVTETFKTETQAKAWKELREHVYKFPSIKKGEHGFWLKDESFDRMLTPYDDSLDFRDRLAFESGYFISSVSSKEDIEERTRLINNYIQSLK